MQEPLNVVKRGPEWSLFLFNRERAHIADTPGFLAAAVAVSKLPMAVLKFSISVLTDDVLDLRAQFLVLVNGWVKAWLNSSGTCPD